jgi:predicted ATPase
LPRFESLLKKINLDTILIPHQHSGFNGGQKKKTIGAATGQAIEYYRFGYIDALEYNNPNVQGILRSELNGMGLPARTVVGSDCHSWANYPKHDSQAKIPESFCAQIKALPTFKGLLMALSSPNTRMNPIQPKMRPEYIKSLRMCGNDIPLSPGINVIIGENGIGKSSLLALMQKDKKVTKWQKRVRKEYGIECDGVSESNCVCVDQGQLTKGYQHDSIFDGSLFKSVQNSNFESKTRAFAEALKRKIQNNIERKSHAEAACNTSFRIDETKEGTTFSFTVSCPEDFAKVENKWEEPHHKLNEISRSIASELEREGTYDTDDTANLAEAKRLVDLVDAKIKSKYMEVDSEAQVKGVIQNAVKAYTSKVEKDSSDADRLKAEYRAKKSGFVELVIQLAADEAKRAITVPKIAVDDGDGESVNPSYGFKFVRKAAYRDVDDLSEAFCQMFTVGYQSLDKLETIETADGAAMAIPRCKGAQQWQSGFDSLTDKFIEAEERESSTILDVESKATGNTLGEMALSYYRYKTSAQSRIPVFMADQPEDNISNKRVSESLTKYFDDLRRRSQVIIVTHNPLLVVNQDADNVIAIGQDDDGKPNVVYGCLESEDHGSVLREVASVMDGGKEAIEKRLKAYETSY